MTTDRREADERYLEAAAWAVRLAEAPSGAKRCATFEAWLDADPNNISTIEDVLSCWAAVEHYAAAESIMALRADALAAARQRSFADRAFSGWSSRAALAAASVLLMIMGAGLWLSLQPVKYRTGVGERRVVTLADGSTLSMDAGSAVSVGYTRSGRELSLDEGRAKFVVAKDPLRPFSVRAGSKVVVATGTEFSVERLGDEVQVILYRGHVALLDASRDEYQPISIRPAIAGKMQSMMSPNERVVLSQSERDATVSAAAISPIEARRSTSWESGLLVFNDQPLDDVVARVNRYAERPLRIADPRVRGLRVSGVFRAGDTSGLLQGLEGAFHVRPRAEADAIAIYAAPDATNK